MFETKTEVREYCKYIIQCLVDENFVELEEKGILDRVSEEDIKRVLKEYDAKNYISMPPMNYFNEISINEYKDKSGYWVDIDLYYLNEVSDLTLQLDFRKSGKVIIDDLHVL